MKRVVITGKNGQLASELKYILSGNTQYECFFLGRNELPLEQTFIIGDILAMYEPDIIIHTAAYTAVDKAEEESDLVNQINHLASEHIAEYCTVHSAKLIYISTDYVFDGKFDSPIIEETTMDPINTYGRSKREGERAVLHFCPEAIIIRTSWLYSIYGNNFVKTMLRLMKGQNELKVVSDQYGSPTYGNDLAEAIVAIMECPEWKPGVYHYANQGITSWFGFAEKIRDYSGLDACIVSIKTQEYPTRAERPRYSVLDTNKIRDTFDLFIPHWEDSLKKMLLKLPNRN